MIKSQNDKVIQLDIGGGILTINKGKVARIDEGGKEEKVLSDKFLRKVILTRKNAPEEYLPLVFDYNEAREKLKTIEIYNDEGKKIRRDRPQLIKRIEGYKKMTLEIDRELARGKSGLGRSRYNQLIMKQNEIHGSARQTQSQMQAGRERLQVVRTAINEYRNELSEFQLLVEEKQEALTSPRPEEAIFFDELLLRINKLQKQITGRQVTFEKQGAHTLVEVRLNDRITVPMMVDTGASTVTLSMKKAKQLGITINERNVVDMRIANGETVKGYYVVLDSVSVSNLKAEHVIATVMENPPGGDIEGLLGMSFLENFELTMSPKTGILELRETNF